MGSDWKRATAKWLPDRDGDRRQRQRHGPKAAIIASDLDPTYRNAFGQPLMRMTFDYKENEHKMGRHAAGVINDIAKSMTPTKLNPRSRAHRSLDGGALPKARTYRRHHHGHQSRDSAVNKYLQSWGLPQSVRGRRHVFPHNSSYNSDRAGRRAGLLDRGRDQEPLLKNPGPLGRRDPTYARNTGVVDHAFGRRGRARRRRCRTRRSALPGLRRLHRLEAGTNNVGPSLHGIFMRKAGELIDFRYSPAMRRSGIAWTPETLEKFIADPQNMVPANRMPYAGMTSASDRADLIAYLQNATK